MAGKQSLTESARRFYRTYRGGRLRVGHSLLKRFLGLWLGLEQEIWLRSGLKLRLDLSKKNQAGIFWYDGDAEVALSWAIRELVPVGGVFIDCGANCGLMGLLACQCRQAQVIFIEPHPRLARSIEANPGLAAQAVVQHRAQARDAFAHVDRSGAADAEPHFVIRLAPRRIIGIAEFARRSH
jgi:hypothetical protein